MLDIFSFGLSWTAPSTQKLGRSNICCHRVTSFPQESIQGEGLFWCLPVVIKKVKMKLLGNKRKKKLSTNWVEDYPGTYHFPGWTGLRRAYHCVPVDRGPRAWSPGSGLTSHRDWRLPKWWCAPTWGWESGGTRTSSASRSCSSRAGGSWERGRERGETIMSESRKARNSLFFIFGLYFA